MVEDISLTIPPGVNVENPAEDVVFMAEIGAKRTGGMLKYSHGYLPFELKNAETGTTFTFAWQPSFGGGHSSWTLNRMSDCGLIKLYAF